MFIRKDEYLELEREKADLKVENIRMNQKIKALEEEKQSLRNDVDSEHLENYKQHKQLLAIERIMKSATYGNYNSLLNAVKEIKKVLANSDQTNS